MKKLIDYIKEAEKKKIAIGHFNVSDTEGLWAVFRAAKNLNVPVIIGVSEGERDFIGVKQIRALVTSLREEFDYPIFLNADHTYSLERVKEVVDAGFDAVIFDGSQLPLLENIKITRQCVNYAKSKNSGILVEGELGYIGKSSEMLDTLPAGAEVDISTITKVSEAKRFVLESGVDLFSPAVGNIHGMLKNAPDPRLHIDRIREIYKACDVPLVLHGGSGIVDEDFTAAVAAGVAIVHINTELRLAYRTGLRKSLQGDLEEVAPYKFMKEPVINMQQVVEKRLKLFNGL
ncbi:MAG: class II fructose-bisphosphate aldolase [Patescibacteria group bacterium]